MIWKGGGEAIFLFGLLWFEGKKAIFSYLIYMLKYVRMSI